MTSALASLEARIAAATGPDREIDALIELAFPCPMWAAERHLLQLDPSTPGYIRVLTSEPARPTVYRSEMSTASVDAIVALITRHCPPGRDDAREPLHEQFGWTINMAQRLDWTWEAYLYRVSDGIKGFAICPTPALALSLAFVRAMRAKEEA